MPISDKFASALRTIIARQRAAFRKEGVPSIAMRVDRLRRAEHMLVDNRDEIASALSKDFGHRSRDVTMIGDIKAAVAGLRLAAAQVEAWMAPEPCTALAEGAEARIEFVPKGVVGVVGPWNFPFNLVFAPLAGILAAGNRAVLKPSEITPEGSALMARLVAEAFDPDEVVVVTGGPDESAAFTAAPFDHLIFTGSTTVARHVMRAAAENLTPLTLELGGKNPAIVTDRFDMSEAARRIMAVKGFNAGQICLSPDYALVPAGREKAFAEACVAASQTLFPAGVGSDDYTAIITDRHFKRLTGLVEDARAKGAEVVEAFPASSTANERLLSPTFLVNATDNMEAMKDEIFGPVLPIIGYRSLDEAIDRVRAGHPPLALYYFGENDHAARKVLDGTASGGVTINDAMTHVFVEDLPFGGVGASGMGSYHGKAGFLTFSHARSIYVQSVDPKAAMLFRPPFGQPVRHFIEQALRGHQSAA